jgi:putative effector of murein hydrolase LrgA (UPF0299 family)
MPLHLLLLMGFQLAGELIVAGLSLIPGPLCGLLLLFGWLYLSGGPSETFDRTAAVLIDCLGLLFVPVGAAIIGFGGLLLSQGVAIGAALLLSTGLAILVGGLVSGARRASAAPQVSRGSQRTPLTLSILRSLTSKASRRPRNLIQPGPNNPVGLVWIALSEPGYGIHGSPLPSAISRQRSHGCVRLTNWDALDLAKMVRKGTPVDFIENTREARR